MKASLRELMLRGSIVAFVFAAPLCFAQSVNAQTSTTNNQTASQQDEADNDLGADIIVTGTSLRGVAPVGSNLVSVGRQAIEETGAQTLQQVLRNIPQLTSLGSTSQGQNAGSAYYSVNIHQLGSSASNSTLTLIDGHRLPIGGTNHPLPDPNIIPPIAIERVEVLAEGASSTYGSDAVAGVVNFITRRRFDGFQATAQVGFGKSYRTYNAGAIAGKEWDSGSFWVAYNYSKLNSISGDAGGRGFLQPDHIDEGGTNFQSFNCGPATIQPGGAGPIFLSATATGSVPNAPANAPCDNTVYSDLVPRETRHTAMARIEQELNEKLTVSADFVYSDRNTRSQVSRGGIQATVFSTGAQANPFFISPPGYAGAATTQTIRWQADELLGPGAYSLATGEDWMGTVNAEYKIDDNFRLTFLGMINRDDTVTDSNGTLCASCASLALNGTTNTGGNLLTPSIPGTGIIITGLPLTAANALDVWNPAATNRTSPEVLARLTDNRSLTNLTIRMKQARLALDGSLFTLPGGDVRLAVGGEIVTYDYNATVQRPSNTGPASTGSATANYVFDRNVKSAYAELLVPIVAPEMGIPGVYKMDLNVSGRYDKYPVFGSTTNPKIGANWEVIEGLKLRGNWSKSFVAPALSSFGNEQGTYSGSGYTALSENAQVPVSAFPDVIGLPGCPPGSTVCQIGGNVQGIRVTSGNRELVPQKGTSWSLGVDFAPTFVPGLRMSATLFNAKFRGGITSPNLAAVINSSSLNSLLTFYPNGATAEDIAAATVGVPQTGNLPPVVYFINNFRQRNVLNLNVQGLDFQVGYDLRTDTAGTFSIGASGTRFLRYKQSFADGATFDVLNTTGVNQTFPSIQFQGRANLGWQMGPFSADLFVNHVGGYRNWSSSAVNPVVIAGGVPTGGGDKVRSHTTVDAHVAWNFSESGTLGDSEIYVDATNVFDRDPPFYNSAQGYDSYGASPIGRVISVGVRTRF